MRTPAYILNPHEWTLHIACLGLIAVVISIWLLSISSSTHATTQLQATDTIITSKLLHRIFLKCFPSLWSTTLRSTIDAADTAAIEKDVIQNMSSPLPFEHLTNNSRLDQWTYRMYAIAIRPIAHCMDLELKQF